LIRRVRELSEGEGGGVPAIALTAYARRKTTRAALGAGYQRHLSKPVAVRHLMATIAELAAAGAAANDPTPSALSARRADKRPWRQIAPAARDHALPGTV
jgi:DNA-binding response OmpR family regulator